LKHPADIAKAVDLAPKLTCDFLSLAAVLIVRLVSAVATDVDGFIPEFVKACGKPSPVVEMALTSIYRLPQLSAASRQVIASALSGVEKLDEAAQVASASVTLGFSLEAAGVAVTGIVRVMIEEMKMQMDALLSEREFVDLAKPFGPAIDAIRKRQSADDSCARVRAGNCYRQVAADVPGVQKWQLASRLDAQGRRYRAVPNLDFHEPVKTAGTKRVGIPLALETPSDWERIRAQRSF
jgi:hypothetical protein